MQGTARGPGTGPVSRAEIDRAIDAIGTVVLGKETQIRLSLACLLAGGHLLMEDLPGMGKTTLSQALAKVLGMTYNRVQFTSDLLPADILGVSIYDRESGSFRFHEGPVFAQVVLADEINRATPKTQSALLEAMEERQVTVEGQTRPLPQPFFVIATQNPVTHAGTYPLPESQLDRFLMRIELGYPGPEAERELLRGRDRRELLQELPACISAARLPQLRQEVGRVVVAEALLDYLQRIIQYTRSGREFSYGLSPRGAQALLYSARAWAYIDGRDHVLPEDVQAILPSVVEHRLRESADFTDHGGGALAQRLLSTVDVVG